MTEECASAPIEPRQAFERRSRALVARRTDGKGDQHLVHVQPRVVVAEVLHLERLHRLDDRGADEVH